MEIMDLLITLGTALGILIIGFILGGYLKKKDVLDETQVDFVNQMFLLVKIITLKTITDEKSRDKAVEIFDAIQDVFNYIYISTEDMSLDDKKVIAKEQIARRLEQFGIEILEEDELLIDLIVTNFVKFLPENRK